MVFVGLLLRDGTTAITSAFLGCGLMLVGSLLPRLTGTIKVTPGSIELALAERLEATRREAESRAPELEEAALLRAVEDLLPKLLAPGTGRDPPVVPTGNDRARRTSVRGRWTWAVAGAATALVGLAGVATVLELASTRSSHIAAPPTESPPAADDAADDREDDGPTSAPPGGDHPGAAPTRPDLPLPGIDDGGDRPDPGLGTDTPDTGTDTGGDPDPADTPDGTPELRDGPGSVVAVWALATLALAIAVVAVVRRRARSRGAADRTSLDLEPAPAFARRIVDDLVRDDRGRADHP